MSEIRPQEMPVYPKCDIPPAIMAILGEDLYYKAGVNEDCRPPMDRYTIAYCREVERRVAELLETKGRPKEFHLPLSQPLERMVFDILDAPEQKVRQIVLGPACFNYDLIKEINERMIIEFYLVRNLRAQALDRLSNGMDSIAVLFPIPGKKGAFRRYELFLLRRRLWEMADLNIYNLPIDHTELDGILTLLPLLETGQAVMDEFQQDNDEEDCLIIPVEYYVR